MDSCGDTVDFMLSPKRDLTATKLFLRLTLSGSGGVRPRVVNVDGHPAYARAIAELKESLDLGRRCLCRPSPYLNNIIEQDHRFIKKRISASLGFRSPEGAWRTIVEWGQLDAAACRRSAIATEPLIYVVMLFASPEWHRLIPTSWQILPDAGRALLSYLMLHIVETPGAYNGLQQLSYAAVVFLLAIQHCDRNRDVSRYRRAFPVVHQGFSRTAGRAESAFPGPCTFMLFFIGHVALVVLHGFRKGLALIRRAVCAADR